MEPEGWPIAISGVAWIQRCFMNKTWGNMAKHNFIPTGFPLCGRGGSVLQPVSAGGMRGKFSIWQCDHWGKQSFTLHTKLNYQKYFWISVIHFEAGKTSRRFWNVCISEVNVGVYTAAVYCVHLTGTTVLQIMHLWQEWKSCYPSSSWHATERKNLEGLVTLCNTALAEIHKLASHHTAPIWKQCHYLALEIYA